MPRLVEAREDQLVPIYAESHLLWGAGLRPRDYRELWNDLRATPWARRHVRFLVWVDRNGRTLSSLKLYRPIIRLGDRSSRCSVLGAIFTPKAMRGRGHATAMIRAVLDEARDREEPLALLFSDIGTGFYELLGFRALPCREQWGRLPRTGRGGGPGLRLMRPDDTPAVARAREAGTRLRSLAMVRDRDHWDFLRTRTASFFRRLQDPGIASRAWVAEERGQLVGYVWTVEGRGEWNVRELGSAAGEPEVMERILRVAAREAAQRGARRFYGWLPPEVAPGLGDWRYRERERPRAIPMVHALDNTLESPSLATVESCYFSYQDQF